MEGQTLVIQIIKVRLALGYIKSIYTFSILLLAGVYHTLDSIANK